MEPSDSISQPLALSEADGRRWKTSGAFPQTQCLEAAHNYPARKVKLTVGSQRQSIQTAGVVVDVASEDVGLCLSLSHTGGPERIRAQGSALLSSPPATASYRGPKEEVRRRHPPGGGRRAQRRTRKQAIWHGRVRQTVWASNPEKFNRWDAARGRSVWGPTALGRVSLRPAFVRNLSLSESGRSVARHSPSLVSDWVGFTSLSLILATGIPSLRHWVEVARGLRVLSLPPPSASGCSLTPVGVSILAPLSQSHSTYESCSGDTFSLICSHSQPVPAIRGKSSFPSLPAQPARSFPRALGLKATVYSVLQASITRKPKTPAPSFICSFLCFTLSLSVEPPDSVAKSLAQP